MVNKNASFYDPCDFGEKSDCSATASLSGSDNAEKIWNFFAGKGLKPVAIAGILGNFEQEDYTHDPAEKQAGPNQTKAIPDDGNGSTGFGIAQWTAKSRQKALFTIIKAAGLQQYYGAGWGNPEVDKDIPADDIDKLLTIELNYAWDSDTQTKIKDIADKLNKTTSVKGNDGSTLIFHKLFEGSDDDASQIQERVTSAEKALEKYSGTGSGAAGSCSTGQLGGVTSIEDAIPWAKKFASETQSKFHVGVTDLQRKPGNSGITQMYHISDNGKGIPCWGGASDCHQCTAASGWFVTTMTGYDYYGGNGESVVGNLNDHGVPMGKQPKPFSIFSYYTGQYGHTGIVLGVLDNGEVITLENNWPQDKNKKGGTLIIRKYNLKVSEPGVTFAYVGTKLKVPGISPSPN